MKVSEMRSSGPLLTVIPQPSNGDRGIKTQRGGDVWNQVTVMRVMKRLGIAK